MDIWGWIFVVSNLVYWSIFFYLLWGRRWNLAALLVGVLHMLIATPLTVAPFRSLLDPSYVGWQLGLLRFEGRAAVLPATLFLAWALLAAWLAVAKGRGRWMWLILAGDILMVLNIGISTLLEGTERSKIEFGETGAITGLMAVLIMLMLFVVPPAASALWATRRLNET